MSSKQPRTPEPNLPPPNFAPPDPDGEGSETDLNLSPEEQLAAERAASRAGGTGFRTTARAREVYPDEYMDGAEHTLDDEMPLDLTSSNVAVLNMREQLAVITEREFRDKAMYEAFMEEPIVVIIHETSDEKAPPIVFVGVNGDGRWIPRNRKIRIQRKFVERMAQSQERHYKTVDNRDPSADNAMVVRSRNVGMAFTVLEDRNPRGRAWLARVLRSGH